MTAHFTQLNKCSQNSTFGRQFVTLSAVRHAVHLTLFIQFRDRASLVHRKTCIFNESSTSGDDDDDDVNTLSCLHDLQ